MGTNLLHEFHEVRRKIQEKRSEELKAKLAKVKEDHAKELDESSFRDLLYQHCGALTRVIVTEHGIGEKLMYSLGDGVHFIHSGCVCKLLPFSCDIPVVRDRTEPYSLPLRTRIFRSLSRALEEHRPSISIPEGYYFFEWEDTLGGSQEERDSSDERLFRAADLPEAVRKLNNLFDLRRRLVSNVRNIRVALPGTDNWVRIPDDLGQRALLPDEYKEVQV